MPENTVRNVLFIDMRLAAHCGRKNWFDHRPFEISSIKGTLTASNRWRQ
ncbi:hypothetical protein CES86_4561 [Brucella lupini]|uniref:Uncharacterized protein n=1 Tax=Brucella lupini TaxID=255457 RepID=A0A256GBG4_9HYPH|nr:hypothetical protein CES86_4561 [Brucella lupini]